MKPHNTLNMYLYIHTHESCVIACHISLTLLLDNEPFLLSIKSKLSAFYFQNKNTHTRTQTIRIAQCTMLAICAVLYTMHEQTTYKFKSKDRAYNNNKFLFSLNDTQTVHFNAWLCESSTHTQTDIHSHPYCV